MGCYNRTMSGFHYTKRVFSFFQNSVCDPFLRRGNNSDHGFLHRFYCDQITKPHPNRSQDTETKPYPTTRGRVYGFDLSNQPFVGGQDRETTRRQTKPNPTTRARLLMSQVEELFHNLVKPICSWETIPFTKRKHFVISTYIERKLPKRITPDIGQRILPQTHPESVRVSLIAQNILVSLQELLKRQQVSTDPVSQRTFNELLDSLNWEVVVVDNDRRKLAYCLGGGKIVMSTGMLKDRLRSDAEIAYVIGHEIGHILARHYAEGYAIFPCLSLLWNHVTDLVMHHFTVPLYIDIPISLYSFLLVVFHVMRKRELEADYIGLLLMASAGYDPRVAPLVIGRLGSRSKVQSSCDAFFTRHPCWRTRVECMTQPKVMEEALLIYKEKARKHGRYARKVIKKRKKMNSV